MSNAIPVFDAAAVRARLPMSVCIDLMADVQAALSRGEISLPLRSAMPLPGTSGNSLLLMPGALEAPAVFGAKLLSIFPGNGELEVPLPVIQGQVLLFDGDNGKPMALVEAATLTAIRTAAASAAATRALAGPDASRLALVGYGVQAESHLEAMRAVRPITSVRVWGPDLERARAFADRHRQANLTVEAVATAEAAIRDTDIVCAVSAATTPIIEGPWIAPGCHLNLVGAHSPKAREADGEALRRARVFTEITEFALAEAGDVLLAIQEGFITEEHIAGEIGAVIDGRLAGREAPEQITLYKSLGNTAQDLIAASHVARSD